MERLKHNFIRGMHSQDLSSEITGDFCRFKPYLVKCPFKLIAIGFRFSGFSNVNDAIVPIGDLDTFVSQACKPISRYFPSYRMVPRPA